ncbi:MAG TPA: GNAT family N-acetyltransferase [Pyrinomonadaceae bacterium]|nr:GNAT family N-acetyltransferase [Pyrinomonadaceae bacterium]
MDSQATDQYPATSSITWRAVAPDDYAFLLEVYASTRADEMALVPWNAEQRQAFVKMQFAAQQEHYQNTFPTASHQIILLRGRPVGRLYVARLEQEIRIVDITVMPPERNAGIGSFLLNGLMDEARRLGKLVRIYVEDFNPSLRLFERLNFKPVEQQGIHLLLEWSPNAG